METSLNDKGANEDSQIKKERSAAHPAITISDALKFVAEVYKNFRNSYTKRDDIIGLIEGAHNRHLAAATYYNLLNREKDTYQVSNLYKTITTPISEKEKQEALLSAFGAPKLNKELIEKFDGDEIPKEKELKAHLTRFHRITEDASPKAAEVFIENAKYCKVLNESNILNYNQAVSRLQDPNYNSFQVDTEEESNEDIKDTPIPIIPDQIIQQQQPEILKPQQPLIPEMLNEDKLRIRLTGNRFAYLIYPLDLTQKDITIIRKQLDVLVELAN